VNTVFLAVARDADTQMPGAPKDSEAAAGRTTRSAFRLARTANTKRPSPGTPRTACIAGAMT